MGCEQYELSNLSLSSETAHSPLLTAYYSQGFDYKERDVVSGAEAIGPVDQLFVHL